MCLQNTCSQSVGVEFERTCIFLMLFCFFKAWYKVNISLRSFQLHDYRKHLKKLLRKTSARTLQFYKLLIPHYQSDYILFLIRLHKETTTNHTVEQSGHKHLLAYEVFTYVTNNRLSSVPSALGTKCIFHIVAAHDTCLEVCLEVITGHLPNLLTIILFLQSVVYHSPSYHFKITFERNSEPILCCIKSGLGFLTSNIVTGPINQTSVRSKQTYPTIILWDTTDFRVKQNGFHLRQKLLFTKLCVNGTNWSHEGTVKTGVWDAPVVKYG
jgi:hypothetical protein